jgi:hypothetical protein
MVIQLKQSSDLAFVGTAAICAISSQCRSFSGLSVIVATMTVRAGWSTARPLQSVRVGRSRCRVTSLLFRTAFFLRVTDNPRKEINMKKYSILYAEDVPHYGVLDITAPNDEAAVSLAKSHDPTTIAHDADFENAACKRIVHIQDDADNLIATDIALDQTFLRYGGDSERLLCDLAPDYLATLQKIAAIPLYGEPLPEAMTELKEGLIASLEFDETDQTYTPCVDTESTHLEYAVELARNVLAKAKGGAA